MGWREIADRVFVRRYAVLDQTLGLMVGAESCLVVDTGRDEVHGTELAAAVKAVTSRPWIVVITHAHWDHFFGTASFLPSPVWAHRRCQKVIATRADEMRERGLRHYVETGDTISADRLRSATAVSPTDLLTDQVVVDLGGRPVLLMHPGRGHTDHDVVVHVTGEAVIFAGDLVEHGEPPKIGSDAHPLEWPSTLDRVLGQDPQIVVPGHGEPVTAAFVKGQRDELALVAELVRAVGAGELGRDEAVRRSPYPADATLPALALAQPATP